MHYLPETRITPQAFLRRERILPARGEVLVHPGEQVGPADVIARCPLPGGVEVVDVSRALGLPRDRAARCVRRAVGDTVQANDVLASHRGLVGRLRPGCRAPVGGQIVASRDGLILIEAAPTTFELRAHVKGQVASIMPGLGVIIVTTATLIQGAWGSGGEAEGVLKVIVDSPRRPLRARAIDVSCHGTIVIGGSGLDDKALDQAVEAKVRGIVVGSVNADLVPALKALPFPVMITEGFGAYAMSDRAFALFQANAGREATLDADTQVRWSEGPRRPEILIPGRADEAHPPDEEGILELKIGTQVRALRAPYLGAIGQVTGLPARALPLESGVRLPVAEVSFESAEPVLVPIANLEVIH